MFSVVIVNSASGEVLFRSAILDIEYAKKLFKEKSESVLKGYFTDYGCISLYDDKGNWLMRKEYKRKK